MGVRQGPHGITPTAVAQTGTGASDCQRERNAVMIPRTAIPTSSAIASAENADMVYCRRPFFGVAVDL